VVTEFYPRPLGACQDPCAREEVVSRRCQSGRLLLSGVLPLTGSLHRREGDDDDANEAINVGRLSAHDLGRGAVAAAPHGDGGRWVQVPNEDLPHGPRPWG